MKKKQTRGSFQIHGSSIPQFQGQTHVFPSSNTSVVVVVVLNIKDPYNIYIYIYIYLYIYSKIDRRVLYVRFQNVSLFATLDGLYVFEVQLELALAVGLSCELPSKDPGL